MLNVVMTTKNWVNRCSGRPNQVNSELTKSDLSGNIISIEPEHTAKKIKISNHTLLKRFNKFKIIKIK